MQFGSIENMKNMKIKDVRYSIKIISDELVSKMELNALVAFRIFVQQGGKQGSRMFTGRFDAKIKSCTMNTMESLDGGLFAASRCAIAVAKEMEALVSDEHARISLFR